MTRAAERALGVVLVALVVVSRLVLSACTPELGADGGHCTDIALNVADGNGPTDESVVHGTTRGSSKLTRVHAPRCETFPRVPTCRDDAAPLEDPK